MPLKIAVYGALLIASSGVLTPDGEVRHAVPSLEVWGDDGSAWASLDASGKLWLKPGVSVDAAATRLVKGLNFVPRLGGNYDKCIVAIDGATWEICLKQQGVAAFIGLTPDAVERDFFNKAARQFADMLKVNI